MELNPAKELESISRVRGDLSKTRHPFQQTKKPAQPKGCTDSFMILCVFAKGNYSAASSASFILAKHSLQYTGRSSLGWKGTLASLPQAAQVAVYI